MNFTFNALHRLYFEDSYLVLYFFSAKTLLCYLGLTTAVWHHCFLTLVIGFLSSCLQRNFVVWMISLLLLPLTESAFPVWSIWSSLVWSGLSLTVGTKYGCRGFSSRRFRMCRAFVDAKKAQTESQRLLRCFCAELCARGFCWKMLSVVEYIWFLV